MPLKSKKKNRGPTRYRTFVDAYMKARPNEKRADKHYDAKVEWNKIKWNEEYVKEIIEEYFSKYNEFEASSREDQSNDTINEDNDKNNNNENITDDKQSENFDGMDEDDFEDNDDDNGDDENNEENYFFFNFIFFYVDHLFETKPELHTQLKKLYRRGAGRPRVEEQCPNLLQIIKEIVKVGGASDDRRQSEIIRSCLTLDDLREKIKQRGYDIKRTTLYYRLLPHRAKSVDGRRHVNTVPFRLRRPQNDDHGKHEDGHFATATIRYMKYLASVFGDDCVFYLSQDDKCKVPLGLPAAKVQAPMLMHLDYRVRLSDHDWTVAPRHQLTPSVYAAYILSKDGDLGYSGPTYIGIRSAKHEFSTADSHALDFDRLICLKEFEEVARGEIGQVKPILIVTVDGGPDENPRFPKTLVSNIRKFKKYNLDALFILTHA
ncbi:unnamed protein product [Rotaria sp. Silwood1]|nr:unnamed protein product [Rotaria sp. Silwood1]